MNDPNPNSDVGPAANLNPNAPAAAIYYPDPFDDPHFDVMAWIDTVDFVPPAQVALRHEFRAWAGAAGFEKVELRYLGEGDGWEFRCNRGTNTECTSAAQAERWLGFVARGCGCQFAPGQFIAIVEGDSIAARFRLEPRGQAV